MKMLILPLFLILISPYAVAEDLLKARDWTSSDGKKLNATLMNTNEETVSLKRSKDAKTFDMDLSKLSEDDNNLVIAAIDQMDEKISSKDFGTPMQIDEKDLDLALRLNKHEELWLAANGAKLMMTPKRIKRINEKEVILIGDHIAIRLIMQNDHKYALSGDKVSVDDIQGSTKVLVLTAERNKPFYLKVFASNIFLVSLKREDIDLASLITVTYNVSDEFRKSLLRRL